MNVVARRQGDLIVLYLSMTVTRIGFGVIIILFPFYIFGSTDLQLAAALAVYPILEAFSAVPAGRLCDTLGRKRVFVAALAGVSVLTAMTGLTRNYYFVAVVHGLAGIGAAGVTVSSLTMITDLTHQGNRGAGMGVFDFSNIGGYAVGLLAGGRLHNIFAANIGYAFAVTGGAIAVAVAVSALILKEPPHESKREKIEWNPLKALDQRTKSILPIWLSLTAMVGIAFFLPRAFGRLGLQATTTSEILFFGVVALGLGSVAFGALSDRIGRERVMLIGIIGLFGLLISVATTLGDNPSSSGLFKNLYIVGPFAVATSALVPSILAIVGDRARQEMRGSAMGLYSVMLSGGIAFGTLVAGLAHAIGGLPALLYAGAIIFLLACLVSFALIRRTRT